MAKRIAAFFSTFIDITVYLIGIPQFVYFMSTHGWVWEYYKDTKIEKLPAWVCLVTFIVSVYSFTRLVVTYNRPLRERFWQNEEATTLKGKLWFWVDQTEFWIKAGIIAIIYVLLPLKWTLKPLAVVSNAVTEKDKILWLAVLLPTLFVLAVLGHLSAYKRWEKDREAASYRKKNELQESIFAGMAYGAGPFTFIIAFPVMVPIAVLVYKSLTVWHVIAIALLLCLPFAISILRAVLKRRSFLKRLKALCEEKGYKASQIRLPYLSLFLYSGGESFTLTVGEKVYSCKLIPARKRNVPIVFSADGRLAFIHAVKMRGAVIHQRVKIYNFGFESENPKILIVNPVPKQVFIECADKHIEIDNGSVVGDYKFFAATGFLHAAELNVLDK